MSQLLENSQIAIPETPTPYNVHNAIASWFLGPRAENKERLKELFSDAVEHNAEARKSYFPKDPVGSYVLYLVLNLTFLTQSPITDSMMGSIEFQENVVKLANEFHKLSYLLSKYSVPFYSLRYAAHMTFEASMPAMLGWVSTILCNPNNVRIC